MAADETSSPERFIKTEVGGSVAVGVVQLEAKGGLDSTACQAELLSSASGRTLVGAPGLSARSVVDCSSSSTDCAKAVSPDNASSGGPLRTCAEPPVGAERPQCALPRGVVLPADTSADGTVSHDAGRGLSIMELSLPPPPSASGNGQSLPQQLSHTAASVTNDVSTPVHGTPVAGVNSGRPQSLLPSTLDLPFAEAVALLTNGFNVHRDANLSTVPSLPVSVQSNAGLPGSSAPSSASPLASPNVSTPAGSASERRKQQKRLLKKLQSAVLEYHTRLGEECVVVASIRPDNNPPTPLAASEDSREVVIFGSQILENALQMQYDSLSHTIKQHNHQISAAANVAALSTSTGTPVASAPTSPLALVPSTPMHNNLGASHLLPLPPRDVDLMNGNELKSYVPLLLRSLATGRARPMWGSAEHCPPWWPSDVPFRNVRMDTRAANTRGDKTWSDCLRQAVKACFRFHGCEGLLRDLPRESSSQKTPMVHVTLAPQKHKAVAEPVGLPAKRTASISSSTAEVELVSPSSFNLAPSTAVPLPGTAIVPGAVPLLQSGASVSLSNTALASSLAGISANMAAPMSVLPTASMQPLSILPLSRQLRVHFKSRGGSETCEIVTVHPGLTCSHILDHFACSEAEFQLSTAWAGGSSLAGPVWCFTDKHTDVYVVKRPDALISTVSNHQL